MNQSLLGLRQQTLRFGAKLSRFCIPENAPTFASCSKRSFWSEVVRFRFPETLLFFRAVLEEAVLEDISAVLGPREKSTTGLLSLLFW